MTFYRPYFFIRRLLCLITDLKLHIEIFQVQQEELDSLAYIDESASERYNSKAVFAQVDLGVEVEEYDSFRLYTWEDDVEFDDLIKSVQPYFAFLEDPALEMLEKKTDSIRYRSGRNYETLQNDLVYDPVREWRGEDRWSDYNVIQINLGGAKVVWDDKQNENKIRVYEIEDEVDVFEKLFPEITDSGKCQRIVSDMASFDRNQE